MKKIILILLLFAGTNAYSQDSTNKNTGIITKKTFGPYLMNGKKLSFKELKTEIYKVPAAIPLYKKANTSLIIGCSFILPLAIFARKGNQNSIHRIDSVNKADGFMIAASVSSGAIIYFLLHSMHLYKKAVRARNSAVKTIY